MNPGKLVFMAIMGGMGWWQQDVVSEQIAFANNLLPTLQAQIEMDSMRTALAIHYNEHGKLPDDMERYLSSNYSTGSKPAGIDHFGTPYVGDYDPDTNLPLLRGCGPDLECFTDDDIVIKIISQKKEDEEGEDYSTE